MTRMRGKGHQECIYIYIHACMHAYMKSVYLRLPGPLSIVMHITGHGGPCQGNRGGDVGEVCGQQGGPC